MPTFQNSSGEKSVEILHEFFHSLNICPSCCLHSGRWPRDSDALRKHSIGGTELIARVNSIFITKSHQFTITYFNFERWWRSFVMLTSLSIPPVTQSINREVYSQIIYMTTMKHYSIHCLHNSSVTSSNSQWYRILAFSHLFV